MGKKSRKPKKKAAADVARQMTAEADESPSILGGDPPASLGKRPKICVVCGNEALKKCAGCVSTRYCGTECQTRHWPRHKERFCRPMQVVVHAKARFASHRASAAEYFTVAISSLAQTERAAPAWRAGLREKVASAIVEIKDNFHGSLVKVAAGVATAASSAESPIAAAAIAKSVTFLFLLAT